MGPLVSVVIPTYNYARFVARAIESVLGQDHAPLECIVVDDGSTDATPEVLARYAGRIRVIRQENRGISGARNTGLRAARGAYVAFLDADDAWKPGKLARQVAVLEADPSIGAVGCGQEHELPGAPPRPLPARPVAPDLPDRLRGIATREAWVEGSGSGAVVRASVLAEVGAFDEGLQAAEDWDMWLRIAARHRIFNVPEVLVSISRHGTGTFRNVEKMRRSQWKVYEAAIARWPDLLDARTRRRMRALILADAGAEQVHAGQRREALGSFLAAVRAWPWERSWWRSIAVLIAKGALRR